MVSLRAPEGVQGQQSAGVVGLPHCLFCSVCERSRRRQEAGGSLKRSARRWQGSESSGIKVRLSFLVSLKPVRGI